MSQYDEAEAVELLTRTADRLQGRDRNPAREKAAADLIAALKGLNGKAGLQVGDWPNPQESGVAVAVKGPNTTKRAWVGKDEWGVIYVRPLGRGATSAGEIVEVKDLRLDATGTQLEGAKEDSFYVPEPGKPRRHRSALAVLVEAITSNLGP